MTTSEIEHVLRTLHRHDTLFSRYTHSQSKAASDIWNRLAGAVNYEEVTKALKKYRGGNYNKRHVFNPAMFVHFTLAEAMDIFNDYHLKISAGSGFAYCGYPPDESEEDALIRDMILREHYGKPITEIYASIRPKQIIIKAEGSTISRFWDQEEYDAWKEKWKKNNKWIAKVLT